MDLKCQKDGLKNVILISCVKKKLSKSSFAKDLYISPLFKLSLKYANSLNPYCIHVLSAKYGLIDLDKEIEPYELTLNSFPMIELKKWSHWVIKDIESKYDVENTMFTILAGKKYSKYLLRQLKFVNTPLGNLRFGPRLRKLKELTA